MFLWRVCAAAARARAAELLPHCPTPPPLLPLTAPCSLSDISHLEAARLSISDSRYEKPNAFGDHPRPSGIKANFR